MCDFERIPDSTNSVHFDRKPKMIQCLKLTLKTNQIVTQSLVDPSGGGRHGGVPPALSGSKFFHFHAVFGKKRSQNKSQFGIGGPRENPRSTLTIILIQTKYISGKLPALLKDL